MQPAQAVNHPSDGLIAMPAIVNAHDHGYGTAPMAFGAVDDALEPWICGLGDRPPTDPYLEAAVAFSRMALGGISATVHCHNSFNAPRLLDGSLRLKAEPRLRFAGQITGVEGYVESAAIGLLAGRFAAAERLGRAVAPPPTTTAHGALLGHITGGAEVAYTISTTGGALSTTSINFGESFTLITTSANDSSIMRVFVVDVITGEAAEVVIFQGP